MKRASRFSFSPAWKVMLNDLGINISHLLKVAELPTDLLNREGFALSPEQYFRFWNALEIVCGDKLPLLLAEKLTVEAFDAPIFASICSPNMATAVQRLQHYKPLIGPIILNIKTDADSTTLSIECYGYHEWLPKTLGMCEMVFFTQLIRLTTRTHVQPLSVKLPQTDIDHAAYTEYFGCKPEFAKLPTISFASEDMLKPFLTENALMWNFFEGELSKRLSSLSDAATTTDRVRAVLIELLPSGETSANAVAKRLAISTRTLQRRLTEEAETFQNILQQVRAELADHYLQRSSMSLGEISFLLGFKEPNSFIRAYTGWKGVSPGVFRANALS